MEKSWFGLEPQASILLMLKQEQAQEGSFNSPELFPILMVLEISKQ